jgi:hypothetical protein
MGNRKDHFMWSSFILAVGYAAILAVILGEYYVTILISTIFFIVGSVMPDVDLPQDTWWRTLIFITIFPIAGYIISKRAVHWGRVHSIGFGIILSTSLLGVLLVLNFPIDSGIILATSFGLGFFSHLVIDQAYHDIRKKRGKKRALKLWSNDWVI